MDNRYYENVIKEMQPFLDENGIKSIGNDIFANESKQFSVAYNENRQGQGLVVPC